MNRDTDNVCVSVDSPLFLWLWGIDRRQTPIRKVKVYVMARGTAVCTCKICGKKFTMYKNCYNRADADRWEAYAEDHYDECSSCHKEEQEKIKLARINCGKLPDLEGSAKQIKWAESLRIDILDGFVGLFKYTQTFTDTIKNCQKELDDDDVEDILKKVDAITETIEKCRQTLDESKNITSASWWIDNRSYLDVTNDYCESNDTEGQKLQMIWNASSIAEGIISVCARLEKVVHPAPEKPVEYERVTVPYALYKKNWRNNATVADSYDAGKRTIIMLVTKNEKDNIVKVVEQAEQEAKKLLEDQKRRTTRIHYADYKNGTFSSKVDFAWRDTYDRKDKTIAVVVKSEADIDEIQQYYEKNKDKIKRKKLRGQFKRGEIEEYTITPETIDADSMNVTVPEDLKNVSA